MNIWSKLKKCPTGVQFGEIPYFVSFSYLNTFLKIIFTHILAQFSPIVLVPNTKLWDDKKNKIY